MELHRQFLDFEQLDVLAEARPQELAVSSRRNQLTWKIRGGLGILRPNDSQWLM